MTVPHDVPLALYVHLPWCVRKCPYCDFNSHEQRGARAILPSHAACAMTGDGSAGQRR